MAMSRTAEILRGTVILLIVVGGLGWACWRALTRSDDPARLIFKWVITAVILVIAFFSIRPVARAGDAGSQIAGVLMGLVFGLALAVVWRHSLADIVAKPIESLYDGGSAPPDPEPFYSIAQARRNQGKFQEALREVQKQLALFPNDFTGQMLMAQIQAENLKDLPAAQLTVERLCVQPGRLPAQIAGAWNAIADWHLKYSLDAEAARQAFEKIIELLPDTPEAQVAAQRIAHLATTESLVAAQDRAPIQLHHGAEDIGLRKDSSDLQRQEINPAAQAADLVRHLGLHPLDFEARERLALIYAEHYNRLDLAANELEQLVQHPNQSARHVAHWLNLLADLQVRMGAGLEAARQTLERIIELHPNSAVAENARQRLDHLRLEFKKNEASQTIKLGSYEKDLGLKPQ